MKHHSVKKKPRLKWLSYHGSFVLRLLLSSWLIKKKWNTKTWFSPSESFKISLYSYSPRCKKKTPARYVSFIYFYLPTVQYSTVQYCTVQYSTVQYCTVQYCTVLYSTVLYCTVLYCTVQYSTVQYSTVLYCTVLYSTVLYSTVQYCTVLYSTVLYCTVLLGDRSKWS